MNVYLEAYIFTDFFSVVHDDYTQKYMEHNDKWVLFSSFYSGWVFSHYMANDPTRISTL